MKSMKTKKRILITIAHLFLAVLAVIWVFPIFWVIMTSFRAGKGSYSTEFIPDELTLGNYVKLFTDTGVFDFPRMYEYIYYRCGDLYPGDVFSDLDRVHDVQDAV